MYERGLAAALSDLFVLRSPDAPLWIDAQGEVCGVSSAVLGMMAKKAAQQRPRFGEAVNLPALTVAYVDFAGLWRAFGRDRELHRHCRSIDTKG